MARFSNSAKGMMRSSNGISLDAPEAPGNGRREADEFHPDNPGGLKVAPPVLTPGMLATNPFPLLAIGGRNGARPFSASGVCGRIPPSAVATFAMVFVKLVGDVRPYCKFVVRSPLCSTGPDPNATARSMQFSSSRTLPGQS